MYSREERQIAVARWLKYEKCSTLASKELGYSCIKMFKKWHNDFLYENLSGVPYTSKKRDGKYTHEEKDTAIQYYLDHGKCLAKTIRTLGYPCLELLSKWCIDFAPIIRKPKKVVLPFSPQLKKDAVIALCSRNTSVVKIAYSLGTTRTSLYKWKNGILGKEYKVPKIMKNAPILDDYKSQLLSEIEQLKAQIGQLKIEKDIMEAEAEIKKKTRASNQSF